MICPNCNTNLPDGLKFCSECGSPLSYPVPLNQPIPQPHPATGLSGDQYATTSLRFGIVGACFDLTIFLSVVGLILGIVGIKKSSNAVRMGVKSGKQKVGLILSIISLVLSVVIPFVFLASCVSTHRKNAEKASVSRMSDEEIISGLAGTYTGSNGSVLILNSDMTSYYYYPRFGISTNTWTFKDNRIEMFISNCLCNVDADIDEKNLDTFFLKSDSPLWDDESFTKVSTDTRKLSEKECDALLGKETTSVTIGSKSTTTATKTDVSSGGASISKDVNGMTVREALDKYEEYMDRYVALYKGMMDGSLNYVEALDEITKLESDMDELEKALDTLSESDMTADDYKYYLEVMSRVNEKLLSLY